MTGLPISIENLPQDNDAATWRTVEVMGQAVRGELPPDKVGWRSEKIRRKALEIVSGAQGDDQQIEKLFLFVRDGIPYRRDQVDTQRVQDAWQTLTLNSGKCVDKVVLLAALLGSIGYVSRFVLQRMNAGEDWSHVYLEVWDENNQHWIALDPTADGIAPHPLGGVDWRAQAHQEATFDIFKGAGMPVGSGYGQPVDDGFDWNNVVNQAGNVLGAWLGGPNYASSNADGAYPLDAYGRPYNPQTGQLVTPPNQAGASVSPFGTQFNIPFWMWAVGGIIVGSYLFGKGRR